LVSIVTMIHTRGYIYLLIASINQIKTIDGSGGRNNNNKNKRLTTKRSTRVPVADLKCTFIYFVLFTCYVVGKKKVFYFTIVTAAVPSHTVFLFIILHTSLVLAGPGPHQPQLMATPFYSKVD